MSTYKLINGDCIEEMKKMDANSIDSIVTDPPYEIGFMNKGWDSTGIAYNIEVWKQALRVLKPGGHMLAFSSTRTYHRMVCAIENAGFEIRDQLAWIYGSGFPKSQNVGKMIAKKSNKLKNTKTYMPDICDDRNVKNSSTGSPRCQMCDKSTGPIWKKCPDNRADCIKPWEADVQDNEWNGWGTALKPAQEPIVLARKPLSENTVAANVIKHSTGAINIDDSRVAYQGDYRSPAKKDGSLNSGGSFGCGDVEKFDDVAAEAKGRWPANIIHDGSEQVMELFPDTGKATGKTVHQNRKRKGFMLSGSPDNVQTANSPDNYGDGGSAARFFYCAKANKHDRDEGCEELDAKSITNAKGNGLGRICNICSASQLKPCDCENNSWILPAINKNNHPTVKPTALMMYLIKLITPINGTVLDPFNGSGSTGKAAMLCKQYNYIGIDLNAEYITISQARIQAALSDTDTDTDKDTDTDPDTQFFID